MSDFIYTDIHYSNKEGAHSKWQRVALSQVPKIIAARTDPEKYSNWFTTLQHFDSSEHKDNELEICNLAFDFDCDDIQKSLSDTRNLVNNLVSVYNVGISSEEVMVYYSGNRGFHVTINNELLEAEPQVDLIKVYRLIAEWLYKQLKLETMDRSVYTRRRAWRVPNTRHGKTGLYKRALTLDELNSDIENIKELAKEPCSWIDLEAVI